MGCSLSNDDVLAKIAEKLEKSEQFRCTYSFQQVAQNSPGASWKTSGSMSFDFTEKNALGSRIYLSRNGSDGFKRMYKSDTLFDIRSRTSTLVKTPSLNKDWLYGNLALYLSPYELRKVLPYIINDSTTTVLSVKDTIIQNIKAIQVQFELDKFIFSGKLMDNKNQKKRYNLSVRKEDWLPIEFEAILEDGFSKISFNNIINTVDDSIWELSSQEQEYFVLSGEEDKLLAKNQLTSNVGKKITTWKLPTLEGDILSDSSFKNKLTLYEFFFVGCVGSIKARPVINELKKEFGDKLQVIHIETQNFTNAEVQSFVDKYKLNKPILYNGKDLANQLGAFVCPTFVLVDKSGIISYTSTGKPDELMRVIKEKLKDS